MTQVWSLIWDSFRESIDRMMFWVMVVLTVVLAAAMACVSFDEKGVNILFGAWKIESESFSLSNPDFSSFVGTIVVKFIADYYLGLLGVIVALITTAGVFPSLMTSGTVDLLLSKPMSRSKLFLSKYIGALTFVFLQSLLFVGLTFLVMGIRWHVWIWGYWGFVLLLVILFSYLFAFTALFGVMTRSSLTALLLTGVAWMVIWTPTAAADTLEAFRMAPGMTVNGEPVERSDEMGKWERVFRTASWFVPKTTDITEIAGQWVGAALFSDLLLSVSDSAPEQQRRDLEESREFESKVSPVDPLTSIGSSLLSEAVIVLLAMYQFGRRDY